MRTNVTVGSVVPGNESAWERNVPVPLCPSLQYSFSQGYQIQLPTKPQFGFQFLQFQL